MRHFAPAVWDDDDNDDVGVDYDACSPGCAQRVMELAALGAGNAS
jgi:hypothetical protein